MLNPGMPGTKLNFFRNNLEIPCHPISNRLYEPAARVAAGKTAVAASDGACAGACAAAAAAGTVADNSTSAC